MLPPHLQDELEDWQEPFELRLARYGGGGGRGSREGMDVLVIGRWTLCREGHLCNAWPQFPVLLLCCDEKISTRQQVRRRCMHRLTRAHCPCNTLHVLTALAPGATLSTIPQL